MEKTKIINLISMEEDDYKPVMVEETDAVQLEHEHESKKAVSTA